MTATNARRLLFRHVLAGPLALSLACSVLLIERRYGLVHAGFLSTAVLSGWQVPIFLGASAVLDLSVLAAADALCAIVCRILGAGARRYATASVAVLAVLVVAVNVLHYNVVGYLGDVMHLRAALHVSRGVTGTLPFFGQWLLANALLLGLAGGAAASGAGLVARLARDVPDIRPVPLRRPLRRAGFFGVAAVAIEIVICHAPGVPAGHVATSLRRTSLQRIVEGALSELTDWDGDGVGWIDHPADFAPFDAARSPFAVDIPGDGIDQDGVGGDLPATIDVDPPVVFEPTLEPGRVVSRPDIVVVVPCSLRADALTGSRDLGPAVMPNLERLARDGLAHGHAYSHCGHTIAALQQVLSGQHARHTRSLVRDMKAAGYRVGVVSTQDESFGGTDQATGLSEADFFADARSDPNARVTGYSAPSSIILPARWALGKADEFLAGPGEQPIFLFIHLETCHYPYFHDSPDDLVPHPALAISEDTPENRSGLIALYRNAAANLDRRLGELSALVAARRGAAVVSIVMADHGEAIYDDGVLGHGTAIGETAMHVPCVIANGWGTVPSPFGHTDVRPFILSMLASERPAHAAIEVRPSGRPIFQWVGSLKAPHQLGLVRGDEATVVDFDALGDGELSGDATHAVRMWESLRLTK